MTKGSLVSMEIGLVRSMGCLGQKRLEYWEEKNILFRKMNFVSKHEKLDHLYI